MPLTLPADTPTCVQLNPNRFPGKDDITSPVYCTYRLVVRYSLVPQLPRRGALPPRLESLSQVVIRSPPLVEPTRYPLSVLPYSQCTVIDTIHPVSLPCTVHTQALYYLQSVLILEIECTYLDNIYHTDGIV